MKTQSATVRLVLPLAVLIAALVAAFWLCPRALADELAPTVQANPAAPQAATAKAGVAAAKVGATYRKYDLTGDGKADKVQIRSTKGDGRTRGDHVDVLVNGRRVWSTSDVYSHTMLVVSPSFKFCVLKNGKAYLYYTYVADSASVVVYGLIGQSGSKAQGINLLSAFGARFAFEWHDVRLASPKVSGNSIELGLKNPLFNKCKKKPVLKYVYRGSKLVLGSRTCSVGAYAFKTHGKTKLFANSTGSKSSLSIAKGAKLTATKVYLAKNARWYVSTASGKKGWVDL